MTTSVAYEIGLESFCNGCSTARTAAKKPPQKIITALITIYRLYRTRCLWAAETWLNRFSSKRAKRESRRKLNPMAGNLWNLHARRRGVTAMEIWMG